jgi:hypothetical protein
MLVVVKKDICLQRIMNLSHNFPICVHRNLLRMQMYMQNTLSNLTTKDFLVKSPIYIVLTPEYKW